MIFFKVELLLERGADVNKRSKQGESPLTLAVSCNVNETIVKLLLNKGAKINKKIFDGQSILHFASRLGSMNSVCVLVEYGAEINFENDEGETPITCAGSIEVITFFIKELAKLKMESKPICKKNLDLIRDHEEFQEIFDKCSEELIRMKNCIIYNKFSLYDILKMKKQRKKSTLLTKNQDFVTAFESLECIESFEHFGEDLDVMFLQAIKRRDSLQSEEDKLKLIFKDYLPDLVIRKIAYFENEYLFFL